MKRCINTFILLACFAFAPAWAMQFEVKLRTENNQHIADIVVNGAPEVYGGEVNVQFDKNAVRIVDMDAEQKGIQIKKGTFFSLPDFPILNKVDEEKGEINYAVSMVHPAKSVSGNGVVASIYYQPLNDNHKTAFKVLGSEFGSAEGVGYRTGNKVRGQKPIQTAVVNNTQTPNTSEQAKKSPAQQNIPTIAYIAIGLGGLLLFILGFFLLRKKP